MGALERALSLNGEEDGEGMLLSSGSFRMVRICHFRDWSSKRIVREYIYMKTGVFFRVIC